MHYNIYINQRAIIEHNVPIDFADAAILLSFSRLFGGDGIEFTNYQGKNYYWVSYNLIKDCIPMLRTFKADGTPKQMSKDALYRRVKKLIKLGILEPHPENQKRQLTYFRSTPLLELIVTGEKTTKKHVGNKSEPTEINPNPYGNISGQPTEISPDNNTTIYNTNNNKVLGTLAETPKEPLMYTFQKEYLEIFNIISINSGNTIRLIPNKVQQSNKYKTFVSFYKNNKSVYTFEEIKEVIKFVCLKNLGTTSQEYSRFSTLFRAKNFENYFDEWQTSKNKPPQGQNNAANTNTPENKVKLTGKELSAYNTIFALVNDHRFTESVFLAIGGRDKLNRLGNSLTPNKIAKKIKNGILESTRAFNKNSALSDVISLEFKK